MPEDETMSYKEEKNFMAGLRLPDDDPVYTLKNMMEEFDFSGMLACYSDKGRTGLNPAMLYVIGRRALRKIQTKGRPEVGRQRKGRDSSAENPGLKKPKFSGIVSSLRIKG